MMDENTDETGRAPIVTLLSSPGAFQPFSL